MPKRFDKTQLTLLAEDAAPAIQATDEQLAGVAVLAERLQKGQAIQEKLEADLARVRGLLKTMAEETIPQAMEAAGLTSFKTATHELQIKDVYAGHIKEENQPMAFLWLEEHQHGQLIKRKVVIDLGKDCPRFEWLLTALGAVVVAVCGEEIPYTIETDERVHPGSLNAWVKEMLTVVPVDERGDWPQELFGVYKGKTAKLKALK